MIPQNDLRNRKFKADAQSNPGCAAATTVGICTVFILIGIGMLATDTGIFGLIWIAVSVGILVSGVKQAKKMGGQKHAPFASTAAPRPPFAGEKAPARAEERCDNPEPHRHFDAPAPAAPKAWANPAPPRRYESDAPAPKRWPTDTERRRESMRQLYEAGLLTREEYAEELRRIGHG